MSRADKDRREPVPAAELDQEEEALEPEAAPEPELVEPVNREKRRAKALQVAKSRRMKKLKKAKLNEEQLAEIDRIVDGKKKEEPPPPPPEPQPELAPELAAQMQALANISTKDLLDKIWTTVDAIWLSRTEAKLTPTTKQMLIDVWDPVAQKYMTFVSTGPEFQAVLVTGIILSPLFVKHIQRLQKKTTPAIPAAAEPAPLRAVVTQP